ncbi:MAG: VOC family protein [Anaerolineae bacterium]|jgi:catechol 2,3-dioxygenase-like lactoylglutathione lyase family enzyme|nr:VOC family protein [Chloroflexota bacterium]
MARITGLGGVFLKLDGDTQALLSWYHDVLGLAVGAAGIGFMEPNLFTIITLDGHPDSALLNFTVDDLPAYLELLRGRGVTVLQEISQWEYGRFAQIADPQGRPIELWEPVEEAYRQLGAAEAAAWEAAQQAAVQQAAAPETAAQQAAAQQAAAAEVPGAE